MEPDPKVLNNGGGVTLIANWVEGMCDPASPRIHPSSPRAMPPEAVWGTSSVVRDLLPGSTGPRAGLAVFSQVWLVAAGSHDT